MVQVDLFTWEECLAYLTAKLGGDKERLDQAGQLAEDLGRLPLALAQAAAFILDHPGETCRRYRQRLADRRRRLSDILPADAYADDYQSTIAATWSLSAETANRLAPVGLALPALRLAAVLDPNGSPDTLFASSPVIAYLAACRAEADDGSPTEQGSFTDRQDGLDALSCLHRLSLISYDRAGGARAIRIHALVQRAVLEQTPTDILSETVRAVADGLRYIWPDVERDTDLCRSIRDNAAQLRDLHEQDLWKPDDGAHPVLARLGTSLGESGLVQAATAHWKRMAARAEQILGTDHPSAVAAQTHVAFWQNEAGEPAAAAQAAERLLSKQVRLLGPDHIDTLVTRGNLAHYRGEAGDPSSAAEGYRKLLVDRLRILGPDHPHTLITRHGLANWRGEAGDPAGAFDAFKELLTDRLRILGSDHPDTLTNRHGLAFWQGESGDPAGAVISFEGLLADRLRVLGKNHHDTLITRANLAYWRGQAGGPISAVNASDELLVDVIQVLGPDHPHTFITRANVAHWRGEAGDPHAAVNAFKELHADVIRVLGPAHPHALVTRTSLAHWRGEAGDPHAAVNAFKELHADVIRVLGPDHPHTRIVRANQDFWQEKTEESSNTVISGAQNTGGRPLGENSAPPDIPTPRYGLSYWRGQA